MRLFSNASIKTKLIFLTTIAVSGALTLGCAAFVVSDYYELRRSKQQKIDVLAHVIGLNAMSALEFDDQDTAVETLASLAGQANIDLAVLYDSRGKAFATYPVGQEESLPSFDRQRTEFTSSYYQTIQAIKRGSNSDDAMVLDVDALMGESTEASDPTVIGSVSIRSNLRDIHEQVWGHIATACQILLLSLSVSVVLVGPFQRHITAPVYELVRGARKIAEQDDLDVQVRKFGQDEHGELCDAFNAMVEQIRASRLELQEANGDLERRVVERTHDLEMSMIEAQAANRAKSDFLANMSHEIRTPMTAILGFADLLAEDEVNLSVSGVEQVKTIVDNGRHLLTIVNDILDLSKIEAGKMVLENTAFSVTELFNDVVTSFEPRARKIGLAFETQICGPVPSKICSDPTRMRQILVNLLGNALKFTKSGSISLSLSITKRNEHQCSFEWTVRDTGIGMSEQDVNSVFKAFCQADESITRRYGGTGLGLTICLGLVNLLDGELRVESELGVGSKFIVTVDATTSWEEPAAEKPHDEPKHAVAAFTPTVNTGPIRVLLVDDGIDNRRLFAALIKKAGFEVDVADNGQEGLNAALEAWKSQTPFALTLMDMQMPVMDGYTAVRLLRSQGYTNPIVALTAHAMSHERQKCLDAGCDDYLAKPVDRTAFVETIQEHIGQVPISHNSETGGRST